MKTARTQVLHPKTRKVLDNVYQQVSVPWELMTLHMVAVARVGDKWRKRYSNVIFHTTWSK